MSSSDERKVEHQSEELEIGLGKDKSTVRVIEDDVPLEQREMEAKIMRRVDWRLIPILGILYAVAGLDRVNVSSKGYVFFQGLNGANINQLSNARVAGMDADLHFNIGNRYSIALLVFFITYFLFELPSTLTLRWISPRLQLNVLAVSWGAVMLGMGFANDWRAIVACRLLIGALEAGFLPGCMYLLSCWYTRYEVQKRMAFWYVINLFVSAFGNILAFAIVELEGTHGIQGWRWIFIIEGALTIGIAIIGYFVVLNFPDAILASGRRSFLTQDELGIVLERVERDRGDSLPDKLTIPKFWQHVTMWQLWIYGFMFLTCSAPIYAFAYFIQTILKTMGYTTAVVFLLCAPPYLFSMFWTLAVAWMADKTKLRMPYMAMNAAITLTGLLLTAYHHNNGVRYFGIFLGVSGCNGNLPTVSTTRCSISTLTQKS